MIAFIFGFVQENQIKLRVRSLKRSNARLIQQSRSHGFTLFELIITISIASILAAVAIPNLILFLQNERASTQTSNLLISLNFARNEAIKRDHPVCVCASSNGASCSGGNWVNGWIVYDMTPPTSCAVTDPTVTGTAVNLINAVSQSGGGSTLNTSNSSLYLGFLPNGLAGQALVSFKYCDSRGAASARYLEVNQTGRVQASSTPGKNISGTTLTCP